jgi:hypothetical protein
MVKAILEDKKTITRRIIKENLKIFTNDLFQSIYKSC